MKKTSIDRDMRHATSSSERIDGISLLVITHLFPLACSIIGMCQAAVYVYSLGGLKHDHHLSHTQISSSPFLLCEREKREKEKKIENEREREKMRGS
jgi:hypothetical protein